MLSGNEVTDEAVEVTADETSPVPSDDPDQSERKGALLCIKEKIIFKVLLNTLDVICIFASFQEN